MDRKSLREFLAYLREFLRNIFFWSCVHLLAHCAVYMIDGAGGVACYTGFSDLFIKKMNIHKILMKINIVYQYDLKSLLSETKKKKHSLKNL